jgi:hypothetical protein
MSLQDVLGRADRVEQTLRHGTPGVSACLRAMRGTVELLNDTKKECRRLSTTSPVDPFQALTRVITSVLTILETVTEELRPPNGDYGSIENAVGLRDALGTHKLHIENLIALRGNVVPAQDAVNAIGPSLTKVRNLLADLHTSVYNLCRDYEAANPLS